MVFPVTISIKLKCGRISVAMPVTSKMTISELKSTFIEATTTSLEELKESEGLSSDPTVKTIKLYKQSEDEQGNEIWTALDDDATNVGKAGLAQGDVIGVSFEKDGEYSEPVIASADLFEQDMGEEEP